MRGYPFLLVLYALCNFQYSRCTDFTSSAFGTNTENLSPAAFGDFNSDELTDLFVIKNIRLPEGSDPKFRGQVQILLGSLKEPYFGGDATKLSCSHDGEVTSVVPGDYDGDGLMDILVTIGRASASYMELYVHWGVYNGENILNCTSNWQIRTMDEPLAITYQTDLRTDLFGLDYDGLRGNRTIFRLSKNGAPVKTIMGKAANDTTPGHLMKKPHSHAFLDMNEDNYADLVLTGRDKFEVWMFVEEENSFRLDDNSSFEYPLPGKAKENEDYGQLLFLDLESSDKTFAALPVLTDPKPGGPSAIYVYSFEFRRWFKLPIKFEDPDKNTWSFNYRHTKKSFWKSMLSGGSSDLPLLRYMDVATLRAGDFNNDGFVDLLATLQKSDETGLVKTFLLENTPCVGDCELSRTFTIRWTDLSPSNENAVMGVFYDFMQDGILDVIFVQHKVDEAGYDIYTLSAYKNSLDYDANFLKVMVISGIDNSSVQIPASSILGKKHFFGSNLPGPKIRYRTTNQDGIPQYGRTSQLAQSAHFALHLPYSIFGLGRSPNFVEDLIIGMFNKTKQISPIIPNSQLVIRIPNTAAKDPSKWRAQLFVTPSKIIWQTIFALTGTCVVLAVIIGVLHWKERREDRTERLRESQRGFHFDAM